MTYSCKDCGYQTKRSDNYNRHLKTHSKERIQCDCGRWMSKASLWRHKSNVCSMNRPKEPAQVPNDHSGSTNERIVKIETDVHVHEKDGHVWFDHDPIVVDGVQLVLIPAASIVTMHPDIEVSHDVNSNGKRTLRKEVFLLFDMNLYSYIDMNTDLLQIFKFCIQV